MKTLLSSMLALSALATSAGAFEIGQPATAYYTAHGYGGDQILPRGYYGVASWGYPPYTGCNECGPGWTRGMQAWSGYCEGDCQSGCGEMGCSPAPNHGAGLWPLPRLGLFSRNECHDECQGGLLGDFRPFAWLASLVRPDRDDDCCVIGYPCLIEDDCVACHGGMIGDDGIEPTPAERRQPEKSPENIQPGPRRRSGPGPVSAYDDIQQPGGPRLLPFISYAQELTD